MALEETVAALRRLVAESEDVEPYTNTALSDRLDAADGDIRVVAGEIWTEKASRYAELVDVQEGSSRRALGDLYEQSLAMAKQFGAVDDPSSASKRRSRTRRIVRI